MKTYTYRSFLAFLFTIITLLLLPVWGYCFPDDDGDGVDNEQERIDSTDPNNPDSYIEATGPEYCLEWNGFLSNLTQILELRNAGCSTVGLRVELRSSGGVVSSFLDLTLEPSRQQDIIINELVGFEADEYGLVCASVTSGTPGSLDAQLVSYSLAVDSFDFAFATTHHPPRAGIQSLPYNHYFPGLQASQQQNFVAGFVQISTAEVTAQNGELVFYDQAGLEQERAQVSIPAKGRADFATHFPGRNTVGMLQWVPANSDSKFRLVLNRYFFSESSAGSPLMAAVSIPASSGSGYLHASPFSTESGFAVLELSNTLPVKIEAVVTVYSQQGDELSRPSISLPPMATHHVILNEFLPDGIGKVSVEAGTQRSVVAHVLEYGLDSEGALVFASFGETSAGFGKFLKASYNSFLGECRLRLSNIGHSPGVVEIGAIRYEGTPVSLDQDSVAISGHGTVEVDICGSEDTAAYGEVSVKPLVPEVISGYLVRESSGAAEFRTALRPRSVCLASVSVANSPLSLEMGGASGDIVLMNTSTVVATNLRSDFSGTALEGNVTETQNTCGDLEAGSSCTLTFTPGSSTVPPSEFSIFGDNVKAVSAEMGITAPALAAISVTPAALVFEENSSASVTVTNNAGSAIAANTLVASIPGGSNISVQSTTCGAVLAIGASCSITFASAVQEGPTTILIAGENSNTVHVDVTVAAQPQISITSAPIQQERMIHVGSFTPLSFEITNDAGSAVNANSITVTNKASCPDLSVDDSACTSLAPGASCSLELTSVSPYAPCVITVSGSNTANAPTILIAFSHLGGIVFEESGGSGKIISDPLNGSSEISRSWTGTSSDVVGATSLDNGIANTDAIVSDPACSNDTSACAAQFCRDISAEWYFPARNELISAHNSLCPNATIPCDFGGFFSSSYFSSTQFDVTFAESVVFPSGLGFSMSKANVHPVRCIRLFTP